MAGALYLAALNVLTALLAVLILLSYLFLYTPLKRKTPLCTLIGAVPGAAPPSISWAAASPKAPASLTYLPDLISRQSILSCRGQLPE